MSWCFAGVSKHNQQLFMFSWTDAAEQADVEFRRGFVAEASDLI